MARTEERSSQAHRRTRSYRQAAKGLGLRIRELRQRAGWTLEQAAEAMHLDLTHLQKIEAGKLNVTLVTLVRIADGLKVGVLDLFSPPQVR
jgi:transcriptional regulator with XRE-family HTH domain